MRTRLLAFAALLATLPGCISLEMGRLGREIAHDLEETRGAEVDRGFAIAAGRGLIGTSRFLGRLVAPKATEEARRLTRHVRNAKVAVYSVSGVSDLAGLRRPAALDRYHVDDGWYPLATVRDSSGTAWVLYREDRDILRDLLAVVVAPHEIVVTKLSGDLTDLALDALSTGHPLTDLTDSLPESSRSPDRTDSGAGSQHDLNR